MIIHAAEFRRSGMMPIEAAELEDLGSHLAPLSMSLFMPAFRAGQEVQQNPIRFKNLLRSAKTQLIERGLRPAEARDYLRPIHEHLLHSDFWRQLDTGLALFWDGSNERVYKLPIMLPEMVMVSERYHIKPLLPLMNMGTRFYLLVLSQSSIRMFQADAWSIRQVNLPGAPRSYEEIAKFFDVEKSLQHHTQTSTRGPGMARSAVFHGQGSAGDEAQEKRLLTEYVTQIKVAVEAMLNSQNTPLMIAAADPLLGMFRRICEYRFLERQHLHGNFDQHKPHKLHELAMNIMSTKLENARNRAITRYRQLAGTPLASNKLDAIVTAASDGRVEMLFISLQDEAWGVFDPIRRQADIHKTRLPGDQDLLDLAAIRSYLAGAAVYADTQDKMPDASPIAAAFRYAA